MLSQELENCKNFGDVFELVKKTVVNSLGKHRGGLMLYLADLPVNVGAAHAVDSNAIVINRIILNLLENSGKPILEVNSFLYSILLHEYLHSLGYLDEHQVRTLTYHVTKEAFGEDHPATILAANPMRLLSSLPLLRIEKHSEDFEIIKDFDRSSQKYYV